MADPLNDRKVQIMEELERRGELPEQMTSMMRTARERGLIKSRRDPELLSLENKISTLDSKDLSDERARAYANTYRTMRHGEHDDYSGKVRYGKDISGHDYFERIKSEITGKKYADKFPDEISVYNSATPEQQLGKAQELIKRTTDKVLPTTKSTLDQSAVKQIAIGAQETADEFVDIVPDTRGDAERLANADVNTLDESQKKQLRDMGREEAFKRSYVPMREWLEDKLANNAFANQVARDAVSSGSIDEAKFDILSAEEQNFVTTYVKHSRPFDVEEGLLGTLEEGGRKALWALWQMPVGIAEFSADFQAEKQAALWSIVDPVSGIEFLDAWERERANLRKIDSAFDLKAPERSRAGAATVGLMETVPHMVALIYGGPGGAILAGGSAANQSKAKAMELGATAEEANVVAAIAGVASVYAERIGSFGGTTGFGKWMSKPLLAKASAKTIAGFTAKNMPRFMEQTARGFSVELFEEWGEAFVNNIAEQAFIDHGLDVKESLAVATEDAMGAGDVVFLMSLFGGAHSAVSDISSNSGEMIDNSNQLDVVKKNALEFLKSDADAANAGKENINNTIIDAWANNDKKTARKLLMEMGISKANLAKAEPMLDSIKAFEQAEQGKRKARTDKAQRFEEFAKRLSGDVETAKQAATEWAAEIGIDSTQFVDKLTNATDAQQAAQISNNTIEVLSSFAPDAVELVRHEAFHAMVEDWGIVTPAERAVLDSKVSGLINALQLDAAGVKTSLYNEMAKSEKAKELIAEAGAALTPQEQSLFQRVTEFAQKVWNSVRGRGFTSIREVLGNVEARAKEAKSGKGEARFARREAKGTQDTTQLFDDASEFMAARILSGKTGSLNEAKALVEGTDIDAKDVLAEAKALAKEAKSAESKQAGEQADALGLETIAARRSFERFKQRTRREGVATGIEATIKAGKAKGVSKAIQKRFIREVESTPISEVFPQDIAIDQNLVVNVREAVAEYAKGKKLDKKVKDGLIKRGLAHALSIPVRNLVFNRSRSAIQTDIVKLRSPSTTMDKATDLAADIVQRLDAIADMNKQHNLIKEIEGVLSTKANKRVASNVILAERTIDAVTAAEFAIAKRLIHKGDKVVGDLNERIDSLLNEMNDDKVIGVLKDIAAIAPAINDKALDSLDSIQKMQVFRDLSATYGNLVNKSKAELAEVAERINNDAKTSRQSMAKLGKKQATTIKKTTKQFTIGSRSKSGKKTGTTGIILNGFWNIRQRFSNLGRFNDKAGKEQLANAVDTLNIQQSSDNFDTRTREWSETFTNLLTEAYGKWGRLKAIDRLTEKHKSLAKYQPPADASKRNKPMAIGQLMQIVTTYQQNEYKGNLRKQGYNDALVESMKQELSDSDWALIAGLREGLYPTMGLEIDEASNKMFGQGVANFNEMYMPVVTDVTRLWNAGDIHATPLSPPRMNERISNNKGIDTEANIVQVVDSKIRENAHFASFAESSSLARSVFANKELVKQLADVHGGNWDALSDHLTDVYTDSRLDMFRSKMLQQMQSATTLRALSGNLKLPFTQLTSLPAYMARLGVLNSLRIGYKAFQNPGAYMNGFKEVWNSEQFKNRRKFGTSEFVAQSLRDNFGDSILDVIPEGIARASAKAVSRGIKSMYKLGMFTNALGDAGPIMLFGPAIYQDTLRLADGDTTKAMADTWEIVQTTQQSFATKDRNVLSRRAGVFGKIVNAFASTPGQYLAMETLAIQEFTANPNSATAKRAMSAVFVVHVLLSGSFFAVSQLFNNFMDDEEAWDDEDKLGLVASMLSGPANAIPMAGGVTNSFIEAAVEGKASFSGGLVPLSQFKRDAAALGAMLSHGLRGDFDEMLEDTDKVIDMLSAPSRQVRRAVESR